MAGNTFKSPQLALITARGVATGAYGVYVPSQNQSKQTCYGMKNDVKTAIEREYYSLISPQKLLYLPKRISGYAPVTPVHPADAYCRSVTRWSLLTSLSCHWCPRCGTKRQGASRDLDSTDVRAADKTARTEHRLKEKRRVCKRKAYPCLIIFTLLVQDADV